MESSAALQPLSPGSMLGRYRLDRALGKGAMGEVWLAHDTALQQRVCVKLLHESLLHHPEATARFTRELVLARRVQHPSVCRVHDLHFDGGRRFLTMEFVDGTPLRELVGREAEPIEIERAVRIVRHICAGLAAAHAVGVVHRDLKPRNIMVRSAASAVEPDDVCILDFGIATAEDLGADRLTRPGYALGTRYYIAPEVWQGEPATARSDLFAVGVILFNLLVARMPWAADERGLLLERMRKPPPPPSLLRKGISEPLDRLVVRALAFDPGARIESATAFATACDALLGRATGPGALAPASAAPAAAAVEVARNEWHDATAVAPDQGFTAVATRPEIPWALPPASMSTGSNPSQRSTSTTTPPDAAAATPSPADKLLSVAVVGEDAPLIATAATLPATPPSAPLPAGPESDAALSSGTSASWVVGGVAVDLPLRPRPLPDSSVTMVVPRSAVASGPRASTPTRTTQLVVGLAASACVLVGLLMVREFAPSTAGADVPPASLAPLVASLAVPPPDAVHAALPATTASTAGVPSVAAPPPPSAAASASPPSSTLPAAPASPEPSLASSPATPTTPTAAATTPAETAPRPPAPRPFVRPRATTNHVGTIDAAMAARGLTAGDDVELDRLRAAAGRAARAAGGPSSSRPTSANVEQLVARAVDRARAVVVDKRLLERKLQRFNTVYDKAPPGARARVDALAGRAMDDFTAGRYEAANRSLFECLRLLKERP